MIVTAELSLYPLVKEYEAPIIQFITALKNTDKLEVMTHAMSTFVRGESMLVFEAIHTALTKVDDRQLTTSLLIKVINKKRPVDQGFLQF